MSRVGESCSQSIFLTEIPDELLDMILLYLSYNEISNLRVVCRKFNEVSKRLLNYGFRAVEQYHGRCQKEVRSLLPRRESERRDHPLAHHCNILSGIETRLSLLTMTFLKYVDANLCCFIPGKVIDEIYRVLRFVMTTKKLFMESGVSQHENRHSVFKDLRANVILKELRDISSMAMEHFEEKILPAFKTPSSNALISFYSSSPPHYSHAMTPTFVPLAIESANVNITQMSSLRTTSGAGHLSHLANLKVFSNQNKSLIKSLKKQINSMQHKLNESCRKASEQEQVILELNRVLSEQTCKLSDHQNKLTELNRKLMDNEKKLSVMLDLLNAGSSGALQTAPTDLRIKKESDAIPEESSMHGGDYSNASGLKSPSLVSAFNSKKACSNEDSTSIPEDVFKEPPTRRVTRKRKVNIAFDSLSKQAPAASGRPSRIKKSR